MSHVARAAVLGATLLLGACAQTGMPDLALDGDKPKSTDIATSSAAEPTSGELEKATIYWGQQHAKSPRDAKAALAYARNLRALGRKPQALNVLQSSYMFASDDREYLSEYGRLALDLGQVSTADALLARAEDPAKPDWRIVSARGTVQAKQGSFKEAIALYERAMQLAPSQPSIMNNLAMAYTMDGQAARGEELLRKAKVAGATDARIERNLDLVVSLQGKEQPAPQPGSTVVAVPVQKASAEAQVRAEKASAKRSAPIDTASVKPVDADAVIRAAMAAEAAKSAKSAAASR